MGEDMDDKRWKQREDKKEKEGKGEKKVYSKSIKNLPVFNDWQQYHIEVNELNKYRHTAVYTH